MRFVSCVFCGTEEGNDKKEEGYICNGCREKHASSVKMIEKVNKEDKGKNEHVFPDSPNRDTLKV